MGAIVDSEPVKPLLEALETSPPLVQREAARALGNLSANIEYGDTILREGAQPHLIALLRSDDQHCQRMAAMALCNLASNIRNQPKMLAGNVLEPVVGEVRAIDLRVLRAARASVTLCATVIVRNSPPRRTSPSTRNRVRTTKLCATACSSSRISPSRAPTTRC